MAYKMEVTNYLLTGMVLQVGIATIKFGYKLHLPSLKSNELIPKLKIAMFSEAVFPIPFPNPYGSK